MSTSISRPVGYILAGSRVTLRDVARLAQVHYATASTVLNGSKGSTCVSEATTQRVLKAAEELSYKVNRSAQQLKTRRSSVVGLLTGDVENPFFARMVSVCSAALEKTGYDVILATRRRDDFGDFHLLESLLTRDLAGVLIWSETLTEVRDRISKSGMTNVSVMGMHIPGYDSVAGYMDSGIEEALDHLRTEGYKRIAYFAPSQMLSREGDARDQIYRRKMAEFGQEELIVTYPGSASDVAAARAAAEELAKRPEGKRPDALFCFNDMNAFGAMMGLRRQGLTVPGDIALVGCDNLSVASQLDVQLTTIDYPLETVCNRAVTMLLERINAADEQPEAYGHRLETLETKLVIRESSRRHLAR